MRSQNSFSFSGHLRIWVTNPLYRSMPRLVFDRHNLIVNEGRGVILDWFSGLPAGDLGFTPTPFNAMMLTNNTSTEDADDTFDSAVLGGTNYLSDEGVLHTGTGGQVSVVHTTGDPLIAISGVIPEGQGNDPVNNHINSVCLVMGASTATGGFNEPSYVPTGNEGLFARVNVGDLVKTAEKVYTFDWQIQIQTSS